MTAFKAWLSQAGQIGNAAFPPYSADPDGYCERQVWGHEDPFPPPNLNAGCGFSQQTFAGANGNHGDAPKADLLR